MSTKMQQQVACNVTKPFVTFFATLDDKTKQLKELGSWIKRHREKSGLSQEGAAEKIGISRYQWIRIENGQSGTKRDTLVQIARAIQADVNQTLRKGGFSGLFVFLDNTESDDELVADGLFDGYYELPEERRALARKQIAAIIRSLKDEDFE